MSLHLSATSVPHTPHLPLHLHLLLLFFFRQPKFIFMYFVINIMLASLNRSQSLTSDGDLILNTAQICASSFFTAVLTAMVGGGRDKRKIADGFIMFVAFKPNPKHHREEGLATFHNRPFFLHPRSNSGEAHDEFPFCGGQDSFHCGQV